MQKEKKQLNTEITQEEYCNQFGIVRYEEPVTDDEDVEGEYEEIKL